MSGTDDPDEGGGFLSGWSRRKLAAKRQGATAPPGSIAQAGSTAPTGTQPADAVSAEPDPDAVDEAHVATLPGIDEIVSGTDIRPFMVRGVPASLKNAALRKIWLATPGVRDYSDPAVDYAWDWNAPGGVPGGGGTLTEGGVAKMVKDLIGKIDDPAARDLDAVHPQQPVAQADAEPDSPTVEEPAPSDNEIKALPEEPVRTASAGQAPAATPGLPPPRRHGGAVPE